MLSLLHKNTALGQLPSLLASFVERVLAHLPRYNHIQLSCFQINLILMPYSVLVFLCHNVGCATGSLLPIDDRAPLKLKSAL